MKSFLSHRLFLIGALAGLAACSGGGSQPLGVEDVFLVLGYERT